MWMLPSARITSRVARCWTDGRARADLDPDHLVALEDERRHRRVDGDREVRALGHGVEERRCRAHTLATFDVRHRVPDAFAVELVEVVDPLQPDPGAGGDHVVGELAANGPARDAERATHPACRRRAELVVFHRLVVGDDLVPPPRGVARRGGEAVPVGLDAAVVDHPVDRAGATERLAPHPDLDALRLPHRLGGEEPREALVAQQLAEAAGMRTIRLLSLPPASRSSTRLAGSADRRLASTQPADPAPTMT